VATRTRNRTRGLAVLDSSVRRRPASSPLTSRSRSPFKRRAVVVVLVLVSLALITASFRETSDGRVHGVQNTAASVLRPFEVAADRIARPFRDAYGWFHGLVTARSENQELKSELRDVRQRYAAAQSALAENAALKQLLDYQQGPRFPTDFRAVNASVAARAPTDIQQQITLSAGSNQGVREDDPVVTADGLVGRVTRVAPSVAQVTLLSDPTSAVAAIDLETNAYGLVHAAAAGETQLMLGRVAKKQVVTKGDAVVTAGTQLGELPDIYPRGILIGRVESVDQSDVDNFKVIQVTPFADLSSLDSVTVLVPKTRR
jgi:rod shape-determining protein MreC